MEILLDKKAIIKILGEIGVLLELSGENPFKCRAYPAAARALEGRPESIEDLIASDELGKTKGIGKGLQEKIITLATTGGLEYYTELRSRFPDSLFEILNIPNLGPKKAKVLYQELKIDSLDALEKACKEGRLQDLDGFGKKTEEKILKGIEHVRSYSARVLLPVAEQAALPLHEMIANHTDTIRVAVCGSLRRRRETVKDIDLLASSDKPESVLESFVTHPSVSRVTGHGGTKASVVLEGGLAADLRVVSDQEYPFAQHYFTGSKDHNTLIRGRAKKYGLRMNEYGYFKEDESRVACADEEVIYNTLDLAYIPPELREGVREIEWAENGDLPTLVKADSLKGTLHCHTTASDGKASLEQMVNAAAGMGYEYLGIGDHSKAAAYAGGLDEKRLAKQAEEIDALNKKLKDFRILKGSEVDILRDGQLDFAEEILLELDYAAASIHSILTLDEKAMTARLIRAIESPGITFLGHLSGRLLLRREPYLLNVAKVLDATAANNKWIEINANPHRLDLDWRSCLEARDKGIKFCINPDAHSTEGLADNRYGIDVARKAGLCADDIANTRPVGEFLELLKKTRA